MHEDIVGHFYLAYLPTYLMFVTVIRDTSRPEIHTSWVRAEYGGNLGEGGYLRFVGARPSVGYF